MQKIQSKPNSCRRVRFPLRRFYSIPITLCLWFFFAGASYAVVLEAVNDEFEISSNRFLSVESFGVLENDSIDDNDAGAAGATATLVSSVSNGTLSCPTDASLQLCADGSFEYTPDPEPDPDDPDPGFTGIDSFEYQAHAPTGEVSNAIVTLTACEFDSAAAIYTCWKEAAYISKLAELGYGDTNLIHEGFEGSAWGGVRSNTSVTNTAPGISSKGIAWTTNFPADNEITTAAGGQNSGNWGAYDAEHGLAELGPGNEPFCDTDNPPPVCLPYDGLSGSGTGLFGAGGYFSAVGSGGTISIIFDSSASVNIGPKTVAAPQFFGAIKPAGFSTFQFREENGKTGQEHPVFGDDFIFATSAVQAPNTAPTLTAIGAQSIDENALLTLNLTANDVDDGDFWRISADGMPSGASFLDNDDGTGTFSWRPSFDQSGIHSVTIIVTDNGFPVKTDSETVQITVADVNRLPEITSTPSTGVDEGDNYSYTLEANDSDVGDTLTYSDISDPALPGWLNFDTGTHVLSGIAPAGAVGNTIPVNLRVEDGAGSTEQLFTITVNVANAPTTVINDTANTLEDTAVNIDVLANDTDTDAKSPVNSVTQGSNGSVVINPNGSVKYTPNANFNGGDSFTYTNTEGSSGNVTVSVIGVNDPTTVNDDNAGTSEDIAVNINVLANDTDVDAKSPVDSVTQGSNGSVVINPNGSVKYTPNANFNGSDSFTYTNVEGATGNVAVVVSAVNDPTTANDDNASTSEDTAVNIDVLANDTDIDSSKSPVVIFSHGSNGSVGLNPNGSVKYTPNTNFSGSDSFTYTNADGNTGIVVVSVTGVNDPTTVVDDTASTPEDTAVNIDVLANDTDVDAKSPVNSVTQGSNGSVVINSNGSVKYTPDANFSGSDSFTYTNAEANSGTVTVSVSGTNDPTTVVDDSASTTEDTPVDIDVLANDIDNDSKSPVDSVTQGSNGSVEINPNGSVKYTPAADFTGNDSFTYTNAEGATGNVTVSVSAVNDPTTVADDSANVQENSTVDIDVLANDTDPDSKSPVDSVTQGSNGNVEINPNGSVKYSPNAHFVGSDSFAYTNAEGNSGTVTVTVLEDGIADTIAPIVTPPADMVIDSAGIVTAVDIGQATAMDETDGLLTASADNSGPFGTGQHQIIWSATDSAGNTGSAVQLVDVRPIVEFMPDQVSEAEEDPKIKVVLNGNAAAYPVDINYDIFENDDATPVSSASVSISHGVSKIFEYLLPAHIQTGKVIFKMTSVTNAVIGPKDLHTITVVEDNVGPLASLEVIQKGSLTRIIAGDRGWVTVNVLIDDVNPADGHVYDWSKSDNVLLSSSPGSADSTFDFDPALLSPGTYKLGVKVTDDGLPELDAEYELYIRVIGEAPMLNPNDDSDDDGISDDIEDIDDDDFDGIPNFLDAIDHPSYLQGLTGSTDRWVISVQSGLNIRLGVTSFLSDNFAALVNEDDISLHGGTASGVVPADSIDEYEFGGGIFDFEIGGLQIPGQSVLVVIPQHESIPDIAVYRKYTATLGWQNFVENGNNKIFSADGEAGICPAPGDLEYTSGLTEGYHCVQLLLEDGGPNDADGLVNGVIKDPGGVGKLKTAGTGSGTPVTTTSPVTTITTTTESPKSGSGRFDIIMLMILMTLLSIRQILKPGLSNKGNRLN